MVGTTIQGCVSLYRFFGLFAMWSAAVRPASLYDSMAASTFECAVRLTVAVRKVACYFQRRRAHNPIKHVTHGSLAV